MEMDSVHKGLDFGGAKIPRLFSILFFPTLAAMVFDALFVIVDGIFVGHGIGASGIAAISIISPLFSIVSGIGLMFGIGASVLASISLSRKRNSEADGARYMVMMFLSPESEVFGLACSGLPKFAICGIFFALNIVFIGYYQSMAQSIKATTFTMLRGMIFVVPSILLLLWQSAYPGYGWQYPYPKS